MKFIGKAITIALLPAVGACAVVVDDRQGGRLSDEEVALMDERCGKGEWVDGRRNEAVLRVRFPDGIGMAEVSTSCMILGTSQSLRIEVDDGRHAEFRFPENSPFAANLFRVDGKRGATLRVVEGADCPLTRDSFGCKYDVAEAENSRREVLDPIIIIKGGGGTQ